MAAAPAGGTPRWGNLRRSVRLCPVNQTATYNLTATDIAYDQFKVANSYYAPTLVLPASGNGQVMGQELTIYSLVDLSFSISGLNTDNGGSITVQVRRAHTPSSSCGMGAGYGCSSQRLPRGQVSRTTLA